MKMMICDNQSQQLVFWLTGLFCFLSPRQNVNMEILDLNNTLDHMDLDM